MKRLLPAVAILALLFVPQKVRALYYDEDQLRKVKEISIVVQDNVKHGCLPSPKTLKVEAELVLRRSGIAVRERLAFNGEHLLFITVSGAADGLTCVGRLDVELLRNEKLDDGTWGNVIAAKAGYTTATDKSDFQDNFRSNVNEATTGLANQILKARAAR